MWWGGLDEARSDPEDATEQPDDEPVTFDPYEENEVYSIPSWVAFLTVMLVIIFAIFICAQFLPG